MNFNILWRDKRLQRVLLLLCCLSCSAAVLQKAVLKINCWESDYSSGSGSTGLPFLKGCLKWGLLSPLSSSRWVGAAVLTPQPTSSGCWEQTPLFLTHSSKQGRRGRYRASPDSMLQRPTAEKFAVVANESPANLVHVSASGQSIPNSRLKTSCSVNARRRRGICKSGKAGAVAVLEATFIFSLCSFLPRTERLRITSK